MNLHTWEAQLPISKDGRNRSEIIKRICQAKIAFNNKKTIFTSRSISLKTRKKSIKDACMEYRLTGMKPGQ
jgi:hypothetical protein